MYIVAIAWLYVLLLISIMQPTVVRGIVTFIGAGLFPLGLLLFLVGTPQRRRNRSAAEAAPEAPPQAAPEAAPEAPPEAPPEATPVTTPTAITGAQPPARDGAALESHAARPDS